MTFIVGYRVVNTENLMFVEVKIEGKSKALIYPWLVEGISFPLNSRDLLVKIFKCIKGDLVEFCYNEVSLNFMCNDEDLLDILFNSNEREPLFRVDVLLRDDKVHSFSDNQTNITLTGNIKSV